MNAAVFVDFENLYLSLKSRNDGTGIRTRELSLQILEGMLARLRKKGHPMVIGRAYAAFDTFPGIEMAHDLALMGLDPQYVLISHSGKNSADVQLALDVARVVFQRADIELIVIVSGDRDFIPLARQVLEEGRELRIVAIPDTTSGDLRARVGENRFVDALELIQAPINLLKERSGDQVGDAGDAGEVGEVGESSAGTGHDELGDAVEAGGEAAPPTDPEAAGPTIVGHIPVTWQTENQVKPADHEARLQACLEMLIRTRLRHNSPDIWLSPFLKGPMSQQFSNLVHPERRALINDLRNLGVIHVEERDNAYADHPYSVIVIDEDHPMAKVAWERATRVKQ